ncbi:hypothetical protein VIBNISO65_1690044 [Vibrio nigripulchritudo SO65]|uniref:HEXXH motif domain-containing protein n=1 Tax=Vibrio nigripulchritudo TaxID=28173 RepID=UPI0003B23CC8|nr:HEXXH motif domain-containing protein [Vibrio nigripulchritudo]CCN37280.1 hypothetical protein VIBNIAM115_550006 [Vibrio nigripulchritudo AM115]CCN41396.1 hypothetical protein VIBNIFTn2_1590044 [Vibrio nigripulchritudo FTn2]CCN64759.1 hypothetical protein VIBNIPon4_270044 [Vibrio nigripulchritudo POn4]CCN76861.1 hypothetical protein VIBNISO65_1690044 [Vibrio nigripulchritudo SO65]
MSAINNSDTSPTQVLLNLLDNTSEQDAEKLRYFSCSLQAQLFKHASGILLMREDLLEWHQDIQESVSTLSSCPSHISQKLYSSPLFRSWLNQLVTSLLEEHQENQLRALLGLWNNMTYLSEDTAIKRVAIVAGYLVTWDVGLLFELRGEETQRNCDCALRYDREEGLCVVSVSLPIEQVEQRRLEGSSIIVSNTNPLLRMKLDERQVPQRSGTTYYDQIDESSINFPPDFSHDTYESPYLLIKKYCPDIANDIDEYVSVIVPRGEPTGWTIHGYTISSYQGACWMTDHGLLKSVETMVHEMSHIKLRYLEELIPIFKPDDKNLRFPVPWRSDERPLVGIFEGVYVHVMSAKALCTISQRHWTDHAFAEGAGKRALEMVKDVRYGLELLLEHSDVTDVGEVFYEWIAQQCADIDLSLSQSKCYQA